jgi:hypothetical protein
MKPYLDKNRFGMIKCFGGSSRREAALYFARAQVHTSKKIEHRPFEILGTSKWHHGDPGKLQI